MLKRKGGQFYIISALIIIGVILSVGAAVNYAKSDTKSKQVYDFGTELGVESGKVIDYGVYSNQNIESLVENFSSVAVEYSKSRIGDSSLLLVYGNEQEINVLSYSNAPAGDVSIDIGGQRSSLTFETQKITKNKFPRGSSNEVDIQFNNNTYTFELNQGKNFFFIIEKKEGENKYVAK